MEFVTRVLGAGTEGRIEIKSLGITSEGLRIINILSNFAREIEILSPAGRNHTLIIPEPAVYVIQKILTNPIRKPPEKKNKDIIAVKELLYHIKKSAEHSSKLKEVYDTLSAKQLKVLNQVCTENEINLFEP